MCEEVELRIDNELLVKMLAFEYERQVTRDFWENMDNPDAYGLPTLELCRLNYERNLEGTSSKSLKKVYSKVLKKIDDKILQVKEWIGQNERD